MDTEISREKMKSYMEEFQRHYGLGGLFDIIVEIQGERVDKNDLERHRSTLEVERSATFNPRPPYSYLDLESFKVPGDQSIAKPASIYREEHIPAVQEDLMAQSSQRGTDAPVDSQPKVRVLEQQKSTPNPWSDAEVVSPGQLKLK